MATSPGTTTPAPTPAPASLGKQPVIFTMPEKYRDGAQPMAAPKPAEPKPVPMPAPIAAPAVVKPPPPKPPSGKPVMKRKSNAPKILVIVGLLFIALLAVGAFFLLRTPTPATPIPEPLPIPTPTPTPEPTPEPIPTGPVPGIDSDADGLTDIEEQMIYQSDASVADTDADGYPDSLEVANFYNPAAVAPKTLIEAGKVRAYVSEEFGYSMLYPSVWSVAVAADKSVVFSASTGETVTFRAVLLNEGPAVDAVAFTTKNGLQAYRPTQPGQPYFLGIPEGDLTIFVTNLGIKTTIDYDNTIDMIVNSFMMNP